MIDIERLRKHFQDDTIVISEHAKNRCRERGIKQRDVRNCIMTGEIIEQYPGDFPFPSCLVFGYSVENKIIHVVISEEGNPGELLRHILPVQKNLNVI